MLCLQFNYMRNVLHLKEWNQEFHYHWQNVFVWQILKLDWSSGLAALKCIDRVDLRLSGPFADIITAPSSCDTENDNSSLFILTNPGQLHYYDKTCLSTLKSERENKHNAHSIQYPVAIPTINPCMTVAKSCSMDRKWNFSRSSSKVLNTNLYFELSLLINNALL